MQAAGLSRVTGFGGMKHGFLSQKGSGCGRGVKDNSLNRNTLNSFSESVTPSVVDMMVENEKINSLDYNAVLESFLTLTTSVTTTVGNAPGKSSYANITGKPSGKKVNVRTLFTPGGNRIDVVVLVDSIRAISERFTNTACDAMLENGPWFIRNNPPDENLLKEDISIVPVWVKLHGVPAMAFSKDGLSAISTKVGTPLMLDSYTSDMFLQSWGRSSYARVMVKLRADVELKDNILNGMEPTVEVSISNPFDVLNSVDNDREFEFASNTPIYEKINKIERQIGEDGSDKGYGTNSFLEQWRDSYPDNDDYDPYDDDIMDNHGPPKMSAISCAESHGNPKGYPTYKKKATNINSGITLRRIRAKANTTPIVTTVTKPVTNPRDADATPRVNIQDFYEEYYEDILLIIMDKVRRDKKKEVHARLDFREGSRERRTKKDSHYSSTRALTARLERLKALDHLRYNDQHKYVKDPVKIHNIKQKDEETIKDFMERFKVEIRRMKGAPECMRIFRFVRRVNNPELTKCLNEHVPKTMEEMMITTTAFIGGEVIAASKKKGHASWRTHDQSKSKLLKRGLTSEVIQWMEGGLVGSPPYKDTKRNSCSQGRLLVTIGDADHSTRVWMNFMIVRSLSSYNGIIERPRIKEIQAVPSTAHGMLKFPVHGGIVTICSTILIPAECATVSTSSEVPKETRVHHENFKVALHPNFPDQEVAIEWTLSAKGRIELCSLLKENLDIFAWQPSDMTGVPRSVAKHRLNIQEGYSTVRKKKMGQAPKRANAIQVKVQKPVEAGIVREVYYHDWLSNPVMVKKHEVNWRMYVDFTDLNKACSKDC
uniref:Reverse transcriptase domain-containing protein n=1 Tax=Tanacetum cinerariifolium TaxID=118510 RepID=A0A6L2NJZ5_TANCI|nr:reverse transcriptase domain-containing protein [Tanacetum cinerariifolium]